MVTVVSMSTHVVEELFELPEKRAGCLLGCTLEMYPGVGLDVGPVISFVWKFTGRCVLLRGVCDVLPCSVHS